MMRLGEMCWGHGGGGGRWREVFTWHEVVKEGPKLEDVVLNGRAGEQQSVASLNHLYCLIIASLVLQTWSAMWHITCVRAHECLSDCQVKYLSNRKCMFVHPWSCVSERMYGWDCWGNKRAKMDATQERRQITRGQDDCVGLVT